MIWPPRVFLKNNYQISDDQNPPKVHFYMETSCATIVFFVVVFVWFCCLLAWVKKYFFLQNFAYLFLSNAVFPFSSWFVTKLLDLQLEIVQRATGRTTETKTEMFLLYHVSSREFSFGYRTHLVGCVIHKRMALLLWK